MKVPPHSSSTPRKNSRPQWLLRRTEQVTLASIIIVALVILLFHFICQARQSGGTIDIDEAEPLKATYQVDLNIAPWQEVAELPNIGENLAKRIVDERTAHGPFQDTNDLQRRVKGIGPTTVERMRPFLLPLSMH